MNSSDEITRLFDSHRIMIKHMPQHRNLTLKEIDTLTQYLRGQIESCQNIQFYQDTIDIMLRENEDIDQIETFDSLKEELKYKKLREDNKVKIAEYEQKIAEVPAIVKRLQERLDKLEHTETPSTSDWCCFTSRYDE